VEWFHNRDNCNFDTEQLLTTEHDLSHYAIADVDADGINDLIMTLGKKGVLKIINGKRLPFRAVVKAK
jgi:fructose-1-phosphate kinase PfkB-like protein